MQRPRPTPVIVVKELDLHARHVDAGGAFAFAALARDAEIERVVQLARRETVLVELARERETQRVRAAARDVPLVARHAVRRAHGACIELAAVAVVVAHLDGGREASAAVRLADLVLRPVERRRERRGAVVGLEAEQRAVVHLRRRDDLAGIHQALRVEGAFDLAERAHEPAPKHRLDPLRAHEPVAVLARVRALVFLHERAGFLRDRAHRWRAVRGAHVEHGPHVQAADRRVRVPGAARAVLLEHAREPVGVFREVLERHGAVLDERYGLTVALHRHHDVEAGLADLPDVALQRGILDLDDAAGQAEVAHELRELFELRELRRELVARELDEQDRVGLAANASCRPSRGTTRSRATGRSSCGRRARRPSARASRSRA